MAGSQILISKFHTRENNTDVIFTNLYPIRNIAFHKHYSQHPTIQLTSPIFHTYLYNHKMVPRVFLIASILLITSEYYTMQLNGYALAWVVHDAGK